MSAYYIDSLNPYIVRIWGSFGLHWYGLAYVLAFICGYGLYRWLATRGYTQMDPKNVADFITGAAIFGVMLGGRLGYMLFYDFSGFIHHPLSFFEVWDGGMSSHGGMIGLILFTLWYAHRHKISWLSIGDSLCVVAPIGLFFGRCANFINGELYGRATDVFWAMQFPKELLDHPKLAEHAVDQCSALNPALNNVGAIIIASRDNPHVREILSHILTPRHPSQIYEALLEGVFLFSVLWFLRIKTRQSRGFITGAFFIVYAFVRIFCEMYRQPDDGVDLTGPFTRGQFLSLFLILIGLAFIIYAKLHPKFEQAQEVKPEEK